MRTNRGEPFNRRRLAAIVALAVTIALGLLSRSGATWIPHLIVENAGDALWSVALYCALVLAFPRAGSLTLCGVTFFGSACVECSQLIQTEAAIEARRHMLVRLLAGTTFGWSDFPRYFVGSVLAACVDIATRRRCDATLKIEAA